MGIRVRTNPNVKVVTGPVLGKIGDTFANVIVEVFAETKDVDLTCYVVRDNG